MLHLVAHEAKFKRKAGPSGPHSRTQIDTDINKGLTSSWQVAAPGPTTGSLFSTMSSASMWGLFRTEEYWRDHYHWLLDKGYQLRPRYHPEWAPPWKGRAPTLEECQREDYQAVIVGEGRIAVRLKS